MVSPVERAKAAAKGTNAESVVRAYEASADEADKQSKAKQSRETNPF